MSVQRHIPMSFPDLTQAEIAAVTRDNFFRLFNHATPSG